MQVKSTPLTGVLILEPTVFEDQRGFFMESWNQRVFDEAVGKRVDFVQDNHSRSSLGVLRGLHFQEPTPQGKLVRAVFGSVWDVAVDIRQDSPSFGKWFGAELSAENRKQLWIPPGLAHGFVTLTATAELLYKATDYYNPSGDRTIRYDDPDLDIGWPIDEVILSEKDRAAPFLNEALAALDAGI